MERLNKFVGKYMAYIIIIIAGIAYIYPKTFSFAVPQISNLLGIVMLGMGMTLTKADFEAVSKSTKGVVVGLLAQFFIMPLIAYIIVKVFNFPPEIAIGIILVGCCPGGTSSNVITYLAKGDVPLSLSMTVLSTLLAPIMTPLLVFIFAGSWLKISFLGMFISILKVVLVPVLVGALLRIFFSKIVSQCLKILPVVSVVSIVLIVGAVVGANANKIAETGLLIFIAVVIHNLLGYLSGYIVAKKIGFEESKRRAISIEVGMQNSGLAVALANQHFSPITAVPGALFSVWHNISGAILANYLRGKEENKNK